MFTLMRSKLEGMTPQFNDFCGRFCTNDTLSPSETSAMVAKEMNDLGFDSVIETPDRNVIGIINGYKHDKNFLLLGHDTPDDTRSSRGIYELGLEQEPVTGHSATTDRLNMACQIFGAALMKRCILPTDGDVIVACSLNPGSSVYSRARILFDHTLSKLETTVKYVLLGERTGMGIYIGSKGRLEYDIRVQMNNKPEEQSRGSMLHRIYPAVDKLKEAALSLPVNSLLGRSRLHISDIDWRQTGKKKDGVNFNIHVNRTFIPEESEGKILDRAMNFVSRAYTRESEAPTDNQVAVSAVATCERVKNGSKAISVKKHALPWYVLPNHPFVLSAMEALKDLDLESRSGFWNEMVTDGTYTYGERQIPTIGYGLGNEDGNNPPLPENLPECILGNTAIIQNSIGLPSFGWSSDDI